VFLSSTRMFRVVLPLLVCGFAMGQPFGEFSRTGDMVTPRADHTATLLTTGKVLLAGGFGLTAFNPPVASAELYDPSTGTFTPTGSMTTKRAQHIATLLPDGKVLIAGGRDVANGALLTSTELYDPLTELFTPIRDRTPVLDSWGTATLLGNGKVLLNGPSSAALYDEATGLLTAAGAYDGPSPAFVETATLLPDSRVLITGVEAHGAGWAQLYDARTGAFSLTPRGAGQDEWNRATLLINGKVLFLSSGEGDGTTSGDLAWAEVYDPIAGTFTSHGETIASHQASATTLLPDGNVLITGGQMPGGNGSVNTEVYAAASSAFAPTGNMITARHNHTATVLPDGTVLVAGGYSVWPNPTSSAEIYKPPVLHAAPRLFALSHDGQGQGAILHADTHQAVSSTNPAIDGETLEVYCTGLIDGGVIPPQVTIDGRIAEVLYFGSAPGFASLNQVNVRVPSGVGPGPAVPVRLSYLDRPSNDVTIAVR